MRGQAAPAAFLQMHPQAKQRLEAQGSELCRVADLGALTRREAVRGGVEWRRQWGRGSVTGR